MSAADPAALAAEIESIIAALRQSGDASSAEQAQRLVQLVLSLHGAGLSRILDILRHERGSGPLLERLAADSLVASLLALHDLQPRLEPALIQITRASRPGIVHDAPPDAARCELCEAALPREHQHVVDVESRRLLCACTMCGAGGGRYRRLPSRYVHRASMTIAPSQWDALGIPVGLAFLFVNSHLGRAVACYPGPAGATESQLPLEGWPALVAAHPWIGAILPDVEALLVRRLDGEYRAYIVPIDACYELVGRIREAWTGFGGGIAAEHVIEEFFAAVRQRAGQDTEAVA